MSATVITAVFAAATFFNPEEPLHDVEPVADVRVRAVQQTAYAYYLKGALVQYDSIPLVACKADPWRWSRKMNDVPIEECTEDRTYYTVCSEFIRGVYVNAVDVHLTTQEPVSYRLIVDSKDDTVVYRWDEKTAKESREEAFRRLQEVVEPGDVISASRYPAGGGHVMLYFGKLDGKRKVIHSSGSKYDFRSGTDAVEPEGSVRFDDLDDAFYRFDDDVASTTHVNFFRYPRFVVLRPLRGAGVKATPTGLARAAHPGFRYDRRVAGGVHGSVRGGGVLGYTVLVENHSRTAYDCPVREPLPRGTEFIAATEGGTFRDGTIGWDFRLGPGERRTLAWKVKVNLRPGDTVIADRGSAAGIPSNRLATDVVADGASGAVRGWFGGRRCYDGTPEERLRETRARDLGEDDYVLAIRDLSRPKDVETLTKKDDAAKFAALLSYDWFQAFRGVPSAPPGAYKYNPRGRLICVSYSRGFKPASGRWTKETADGPIDIRWKTETNGAVTAEHSAPTNWEVFVHAWPGAVTRYGFRVTKPRFGKDDPMPELTLPDGWRVAEGEALTGVNVREAYVTVEKNGLRLPPPAVSLRWPGVGVKAVYGASNIVIRAEAAAFIASAAKPPVQFRTELGRKGRLSVSHFHHLPGMQAGPHRKVPFPDREIAAGDNFIYALREGFRFLGFEKDDPSSDSGVWLCGFDSNYPNGHSDFPAHFHIGVSAPNGGEINHFYPDHVSGRIVSDCYQDFDRRKDVWDEAILYRPGEQLTMHDGKGRPLFVIRLLPDGTGLDVSLPEGGKGFAVQGERPYEAVSVMFRDAAGARSPKTVSVTDDPVAGRLLIPDGEVRYDPDTGKRCVP